MGKCKPYRLPIFKDMLTFDDRLELIDLFIEIILQLMVEIKEILDNDE